MTRTENSKTYYAPVATFLTFAFYLVLGVIALTIVVRQALVLEIFVLSAILVVFVAYIVIRSSYRLVWENGEIREAGYFTRGRVLPVNEITKIRWKKQNFWLGGTSRLHNANWKRHYFVESENCILPKYPISKRLIKDLLRIRPDIPVESKRVSFGAPNEPREL